MRKASLIIVLCICFILTACSSKETEPVEITFIHGWGSTEDDHQTMRSIYQDFEKEHPEIKLNMISMPTNMEMMEEVQDMLTVGNVPNIIFTAGEGKNTLYRYMLDNNLLVDMMPYLENDKEFNNSVSPIIKDTWVEDNHLYTMSDVLIVSGGYWYNKNIFKMAGIENRPKTWDEFFDVLSRLKEWSEKNSVSIEVIRPSNDAYLYIADNLLYGMGEDLSKGTADISKESFMEVCKTWDKIYDYVHLVGRNNSYRDETELFNAGKLAIYTNGVWATSMISDSVDTEYALLPSQTEESIGCQTAALGYLVGNVGDEAQINASMEFVKYMLSKPVQERILAETKQVPQNPNVELFDYYSELPLFCRAVKIVKDADVTLDIPRNIWSDNQWRALDDSLLEYLDENMSSSNLYALCISREKNKNGGN